MKARWILPAVFIGLAALVAIPVALADRGHGNVAGTYLIDAELRVPDVPVPPIPLGFLVTLGSDGTFAGDNTTDSGADVTPRFRSTMRGSWELTGNRKVVVTGLAFDFGQEEIGRFGTPENRNSAFVRLTAAMRFDHRSERVSLDGLIEVFLPDQDPLDPDESPGGVTLLLEGEGRFIPAGL